MYNPVIMYVLKTNTCPYTMTKSPVTVPPTNAQNILSTQPSPTTSCVPRHLASPNTHPLPLNSFRDRQKEYLHRFLPSFLPHVPNNFAPRSFLFQLFKKKEKAMM